MWSHLRSIGEVLRHTFRRRETVQYPEEKQTMAPRWRGRIILSRDPDGAERCVACYLCAVACPVDCISLQATQDETGRRYPETFRINFSRCIFCGYCEDACPTEAIVLEHEHRLSFTNRRDAIYTKAELLDPPPSGAPDTPQKVAPGSFARAIPDMRDPD